MNKSTTMALLLAAALAASIYAGLSNDTIRPESSVQVETAEPDQVVQSFEREFNREPGPARRVERRSIDKDVLYHTANSVHWTEEPAE